MSLIIVFGLSIAYAALGAYLHARHEFMLPVPVAAAIYGSYILLVAGFSFAGYANQENMWMAFALPFYLAAAFPGLAVWAMYMWGVLVEASVNRGFQSSILSPQPSDYSRARAQDKQDNITGAIVQYWKYYEEYPKRPAPLFVGGDYAARKGRYDDAEKFYQFAMDKFKRNTLVWSEAAIRMAMLKDEHFDDRQGARVLLNEVLRRARNLKSGRAAQQILAEQSKDDNLSGLRSGARIDDPDDPEPAPSDA